MTLDQFMCRAYRSAVKRRRADTVWRSRAFLQWMAWVDGIRRDDKGWRRVFPEQKTACR